MSLAMLAERRLLTQDEFEPVLQSHHPLVEELPRQELIELARWLRARHGRARDIIRGRRRVASGRAGARGAADEIASDHRGLTAKKQIFASGLKRVNARLEQLEALQRRAAAQENLLAALSRKQAARPHHPEPGRTAKTGMRSKPGAARRKAVQAARIGSVSQSVRTAQAARDGRTV